MCIYTDIFLGKLSEVTNVDGFGSFRHLCLTCFNILQPSVSNTHSKTSLLNCFCRFPRNSPIICLLRPFLSRMKRAMPTGVSDTKPLSIRYWIPFSGFLLKKTHQGLFFLLQYYDIRYIFLSKTATCVVFLNTSYLLNRLRPIRYWRLCTTSLLKGGESQLWRLSLWYVCLPRGGRGSRRLS